MVCTTKRGGPPVQKPDGDRTPPALGGHPSMDIKSPADIESDEKLYQSANWLREMYWGGEKTLEELSDIAGCSTRTIRRYMDLNDISRRSLSESHGVPKDSPLRDAEWLREAYHGDRKTIYEISELCDCGKNTVSRWLKRHGIEVRSQSDMTEELNPNWKGGYDGYYGPSWYEARRSARERDDQTCQCCGCTEDMHKKRYGSELHVHHLTPFREFESHKKANELGNLLTLCQDCHNKWESISLRPDTTAILD